MQTIVWALTLLGSLIGGFFLFSSFVERAAPQQAAAAAIAVGFAVLPYCFARAVSELARLHSSDAPRESFPLAPDPRDVQCPSCGKRIRPRENETTCYLCGHSLAVSS